MKKRLTTVFIGLIMSTATLAIAKQTRKGFIDVIIGLFWGDEGKGKWIDYLLSLNVYHAVVRYNGSHNAGHTLEVKGKQFIAHIMPSGIFNAFVELWLSAGVAIDPIQLKAEVVGANKLGCKISERLFIDPRAKLMSPWHCLIDGAQEWRRGKRGKKGGVGTTSRGNGPAFADDFDRFGLRMGHLCEGKRAFKRRVKQLLDFQKNLLLEVYVKKYGFQPDFDLLDKMAELEQEWWKAISFIQLSWIKDLGARAQTFLASGKNILAEGAQGVLLDIDFGDYPNVTSSHPGPAGVLTALGVSHTTIRNVYGVTKAPYVTKVGGGDFVCRMKRRAEIRYQVAGVEKGATTGRWRMCGWLPLPLFKLVVEMHGVTHIFISKPDICPTVDIQVITAFGKRGKGLFEFKKPVYKRMKGWKGARFKTQSEIPGSLLKFLGLLQQYTSAKFVALGTGPKRDDFIELNSPIE